MRINGQILTQPTDKMGPEAPLRDGDGSLAPLLGVDAVHQQRSLLLWEAESKLF